MARKVHIRVVGRLDFASRPQAGTVTIDRVAGLFTVRPLRRRRVYELPLADVAAMVVTRVLRAEILAARLAKKNKKR